MTSVPSFELAVRPLVRLARLISGADWSFVAAVDHEQRSNRDGRVHASPTPDVLAFPIRLGGAIVGHLASFRVGSSPLDAIQFEGLRLVADAMERLLGVERELDDVQSSFEAAAAEAAELQSATQRQAIYSQQMKHLAHTDELTGLPNRRAFMACWQAALAQAERTNEPIALLMVDADRFKKVNDSGGHALGDSVLRAIGATLHHVAHQADIVARLGGDEFAIFTTRADTAQLRQLGEAIRVQFKEAAAMLAVDATLSIGMVSGLDCPREHLLCHADVALYRSKEAGGDCAQLLECDKQAHRKGSIIASSKLCCSSSPVISQVNTPPRPESLASLDRMPIERGSS
jgi:diguanylate cyclase (GGDEF)-like protein